MPANIGTTPSLNGFLGSLTEAELHDLEPRLQLVSLAQGDRLCEPAAPMLHVYFPLSGIVALVEVSESGEGAALTMVGREGMVGIGVLLGAPALPIRALVQAPGLGYRISAEEAKALFARGGRFHFLALNVARVLIQQVAQAALCNLHHSVEQQLARWLLLSLDRLAGNEIDMTHEMMAGILGVRRQGITEAACRLEKRNAIAYFRGHITVLDRRILERAACECYRAAATMPGYVTAYGPARRLPLSG